MADKKISIKEADEQVRQAERQLAAARLQKKRRCFHNQVSGAHLIPIADSRLPEREKAKYSDTTYVCDNCGDIIESQAYSEKEVDDVFFALHSMLGQMQLISGAKMGDKEREEMEAAFDKADYLEALIGNYYNEMVKDMSRGNKGGGKKKTSKGGIGVSSGMMR